MSTQRETQHISFTEFAANMPDIFDRAASGKSVTVERNGRLFRLAPVRQRRKPRRLTMDDPLWDIVGIGASGEPGNHVASDKYPHIAKALSQRRDIPTTTDEHASDRAETPRANSSEFA